LFVIEEEDRGGIATERCIIIYLHVRVVGLSIREKRVSANVGCYDDREKVRRREERTPKQQGTFLSRATGPSH
jgi:hypothetical protein